MTRHSSTFLILVCALIGAACDSDKTVAPTHSPSLGNPGETPVSTPALSRFELSPASATLDEGGEIGLAIVARNRRGESFFPGISNAAYTSSSPLVASVSTGGFVTALAAGTAVITATTTLEGTTFVATSSITVRAATVFDALVLTANPGGWSPTPAHVKAGGTVQWIGGVIAGSGVPVSTVYLLDANYTAVDSIDLTSGSAARTFTTPGRYRYCSNACWDPQESGIIVVH